MNRAHGKESGHDDPNHPEPRVSDFVRREIHRNHVAADGFQPIDEPTQARGVVLRSVDLDGGQWSSRRAVEEKIERGAVLGPAHVHGAVVQAAEVGDVSRNL